MIEGEEPGAYSLQPDARLAVRRTAMAPSTLRARGSLAMDVTIVDLSQTGVRIRAEAGLSVGDEISIGVTGIGARRAYVAWRRDGEYGCAFETPLASQEAAEAFSGASVVQLGTAAQVANSILAGDNAELRALYSTHSVFQLPLDAAAVTLTYIFLFSWLAYNYIF